MTGWTFWPVMKGPCLKVMRARWLVQVPSGNTRTLGKVEFGSLLSSIAFAAAAAARMDGKEGREERKEKRRGRRMEASKKGEKGGGAERRDRAVR